MRAISPSSPIPLPPSSPHTATVPQRTPWHSPVPYLFGGMAAMLGLIAFALLILACSYWKLSIQSEEPDLEAGNNPENDDDKAKDQQQQQSKVYEEKILVIMAGDRNPTFLATPVTHKVCSFPQSDVSCGKFHSAEKDMDQNCEKVKEMDHHENDVHENEEQEQAE